MTTFLYFNIHKRYVQCTYNWNIHVFIACTDIQTKIWWHRQNYTRHQK